MNLLEMFQSESETVPKTMVNKIDNGLLTINDQEEALTKPYWAYEFAKNITGYLPREYQ